jgi:hypothetical protein
MQLSCSSVRLDNSLLCAEDPFESPACQVALTDTHISVTTDSIVAESLRQVAGDTFGEHPSSPSRYESPAQLYEQRRKRKLSKLKLKSACLLDRAFPGSVELSRRGSQGRGAQEPQDLRSTNSTTFPFLRSALILLFSLCSRPVLVADGVVSCKKSR